MTADEIYQSILRSITKVRATRAFSAAHVVSSTDASRMMRPDDELLDEMARNSAQTLALAFEDGSLDTRLRIAEMHTKRDEELGAWKLAAKQTGAVDEERSGHKTEPEDVLRMIAFLRERLTEAQRSQVDLHEKVAGLRMTLKEEYNKREALDQELAEANRCMATIVGGRTPDTITPPVMAWRRGVQESIDKLYAVATSGVVGSSDPNGIMLSVGRIIELLNILMKNPPERL